MLLPDSLASKPSESACLCSQRLELQMHTHVFLPLPVLVFSMWVLLWLWTWYAAEDWPETSYPPRLCLPRVGITRDTAKSSFRFLQTHIFGFLNFYLFDIGFHSVCETSLKLLILGLSLRVLWFQARTSIPGFRVLSTLREFPVKADKIFLQITRSGRYFKKKHFVFLFIRATGHERPFSLFSGKCP